MNRVEFPREQSRLNKENSVKHFKIGINYREHRYTSISAQAIGPNNTVIHQESAHCKSLSVK